MPDQDKAKDCDPTEATEADKRREAALWKERNAEAIASYNEWVKREGLLLAKYRRF
jgi:post-segregation antitoxin (ccd killing protein)